MKAYLVKLLTTNRHYAIAFLEEEKIKFVLARYYDELRLFVPWREEDGRIIYERGSAEFDFPLPQYGQYEIIEELDVPPEQLNTLSEFLRLRDKVPGIKQELAKKLPRH